MTGPNATPALFLAALLVASAVGATAAAPRSTVQSSRAGVEPAVTAVTEDRGAIELAFNVPVEKNETTAGNGYTPAFADDRALDAEAIEVYVRQAGSPEYDVYTDGAVRGARRGGPLTVTPQGRSGRSGTGDARYVLRIPALGDLDPADDVKVNFTQPVDNADEEPPGVHAAAIGNVTVPTSSTVIRESGPGGVDAAHATRASAAQVYLGERITVAANAARSDVFVRNVGTNAVVLDGSTAPNSRSITLDSADLRPGTYKIIFGGTAGPGKFFNVSRLGLEATLRQDGREFDFDERVVLDVRASAVRGNAPIVVTTGAGRPPVHRERLDGRAEFDARYDAGTNRSGAVDAGEYAVTVVDVETGVRAVAGRFSVREFPHASSARFPQRVVTEHRGDVVEIPLRLKDSEEGASATLSIGDLDDDNYVTNLTVVDENGDGEITVEWNTFNAGVNDLHRVFNVTGPDTIRTWGWERGAFVDELRNGTGGYDPGLDGGPPAFPADTVSKNYTAAKNLTVDATTYEMRVVANGGDRPTAVPNFTGIDADDVGAVSLRPGGVDDSSVLVTAPDNADEVDLEWIHDILDRNADPVDGNLTESDVVTDGEVLVQRIHARGVEGVVENRTTFFAPPRAGVSPGIAFLNETRGSIRYRDRRFRQGDRDGDGTADEPTELRDTLDHSWEVGYSETAAAFNRDPRAITVNESTVEFVPDYANDTYYVVVDLDAVESEKLDDGRTWWANFTLDGATSPSGRSAGAGHTADRFEYREPDATLLTGVTGTVAVRGADDQVIRGETNVAPGTLLEIRTAARSDAVPFLETTVARVTARRTFSVAVDHFENASRGTEFTAVVRRGGDPISREYRGRVRGPERASVSLDDQTVGVTDQVVAVDRVTLSDGGFVSLRHGHAQGPVVGSSRHLGPGRHSDVRIALDERLPDDATLVATVHVDDDGDNLFGFPGSDAPYTVNGTAVTDSGKVAVGNDVRTRTPTPEPAPTRTQPPPATPTLTPTPTPEPTPTRTPGRAVTPRPTTASEGGPGFGPGVAATALAWLTLLGARRRE